MALDRSALLDLSESLKAADADDVIRQALHAVLQARIAAEATAVIGAFPHQRTEQQTTHGSGHRDRLLVLDDLDWESSRLPRVSITSQPGI